MFFRRRSISPAALSDEELLRRYRLHGDVADLGTVYDRHLTEVFAVCRRYLQPDEEAEDAVMQLFEQLVIKLRQHEVSNFLAWLHATARNHCLMILRAKQRAGPAAGGALVVHFPDAADVESAAHWHLLEIEDADSSLTEQRLQALEQALVELPLDQRRCLELFFLEKKCYRDIAEETGFDLKQVKSHLQNGKRNLKRYLESTAPPTATPNVRR
ncbi:sigma-70 family RNA polymerase sigma factor [Hymenobacter aerilatus]|uniref:Sigma-70 family RNA polymerase sigma factor n=1 Tax=Hymenobacter aerilatus TaxID=2932251 RepID=A0A8T9SS06_9BACT|nr:sigma-70 family RNA polymerase sigma factor [Hymenobacter aerilatus]UOR04892.1 sigma-70 family RNA polymerase sigma factor [Hymenobacter aerilatus]